MLPRVQFEHLLLGASVLAPAVASIDASRLRSRQNWDDDSWHKYVRAPSSNVLKPKGILEANTTGDVSNPSGLVTGDGPTILARESADDEPPTIIVDFGLNVVGLIALHFEGSSATADGSPGLRLAFSETREALGDRSDFSRSDNGRHDVSFYHESGAGIYYRDIVWLMAKKGGQVDAWDGSGMLFLPGCLPSY
jgi:hypothetical protein